MPTINDLQDKYENNTNPQTTGNSVIQQQINYINDMKNYIDYLSQGIAKGCITNLSVSLDNVTCNSGSSYDSSCTNICKNITDYKSNINNPHSNFLKYLNTSSTIDYDAIMSNNKKIQDLRNELDLKLKDLNHTPDSRFQTYEDNYNYELMMNITWSILATSIIYYVFAKL
jgi:hypothetical protein